jgi:hypothetical protein
VFGIGTAVALLVAGFAAFALARTTRPDGSPTLALTLGTKLSGSFGAMIAGILALAALSAHTGMRGPPRDRPGRAPERAGPADHQPAGQHALHPV